MTSCCIRISLSQSLIHGQHNALSLGYVRIARCTTQVINSILYTSHVDIRGLLTAGYIWSFGTLSSMLPFTTHTKDD